MFLSFCSFSLIILVGRHQILHIYCLSLILIPLSSGLYYSQSFITGSYGHWLPLYYCFMLPSVVSIVHYVICSCLKVILDILEKLSKPDVNALLHEFGFQVR